MTEISENNAFKQKQLTEWGKIPKYIIYPSILFLILSILAPTCIKIGIALLTIAYLITYGISIIWLLVALSIMLLRAPV